ncbi:hypothetical protein A7A78_03980 [Aequorivita soesokkakensis]|uniref:OmpA-like domain-containing protein n=1 Tax=Aequorivita soesokkakensis TaxID=1385699 RepID=A0A1A9LCR4_9FLAO|nr:OmpA family protein [Aequorivita soesokkakensis]OAD90983.1 hypothetical protein A7A78_03980 [Aequorivita soesokkakensis]
MKMTFKLTNLFFILFISMSFYGQNTIEKTIHFDKNSYKLDNIDLIEISKIAKLLDSPDFSFLKIFAYSTISGTENYNFELSKKRAFSVFNEIEKLNSIDKSKFYMTWIGESDDTYDLHYNDAHSQQSCVDIIVYLESNK